MENNIKNIIENNKKWPIIIEGVTDLNLDNQVVIPSSISQDNLGIIPEDKGNKLPNWVLKILINHKKNVATTLVISDIDSVSFEEQEKFLGLLKFKGINGYNFPKDTAIVLTCSEGNYDLISNKIKALSIKI